MNEITNEKELIDFVCDLARRESNCIGFVPRISYEEALKRGRMIFVCENDELCGFCFWGKSQRPMNDCISIYQMAIVKDARRVHHGKALLEALSQEPDTAYRKYFRLHCRVGLESNEFWRAVGMTEVAKLTTRGQRGWLVNVFMRPIHPGIHLFEPHSHMKTVLEPGVDFK